MEYVQCLLTFPEFSKWSPGPACTVHNVQYIRQVRILTTFYVRLRNLQHSFSQTPEIAAFFLPDSGIRNLFLFCTVHSYKSGLQYSSPYRWDSHNNSSRNNNYRKLYLELIYCILLLPTCFVPLMLQCFTIPIAEYGPVGVWTPTDVGAHNDECVIFSEVSSILSLLLVMVDLYGSYKVAQRRAEGNHKLTTTIKTNECMQKPSC